MRQSIYEKIRGNMKTAIFTAILLCLFITNNTLAEIKTFEKEYSYQASEADSKLTSKAIALEQVKRLLLEELGVYLEAKTEVKDFQITKDEIITLTAGIVEVQVLNENWDGRVYFIQARITADPDEITNAIDLLRKDRTKIKELEETKRKEEGLLLERERLKKELMTVKSEKKQEKTDAYQRNIKELSAVEWFEKGYGHQMSGDYNAAIDAYNMAITLDPKFTDAYKNRGSAYNQIGNYYKAIREFDKAIELDPKSAETYYNRGTACDNLGNYPQAIRDFNKAIELNPGLSFVYFNRGIAYHNLKNYRQAMRDYRTAAQLGHKQAQDFLRLNRITW